MLEGKLQANCRRTAKSAENRIYRQGRQERQDPLPRKQPSLTFPWRSWLPWRCNNTTLQSPSEANCKCPDEFAEIPATNSSAERRGTPHYREIPEIPISIPISSKRPKTWSSGYALLPCLWLHRSYRLSHLRGRSVILRGNRQCRHQ